MELANSVHSLVLLDETDAYNRDTAIEAALARMTADGLFPATLVPELKDALIRRDELGPTGIGEGVAIPHAWHAGLDRLASALAVSRRGIHYPSLDGEPVHILVVIITPPGKESDAAKQSLLDTWLGPLRNPAFRAALRQAASADEVHAVLRSEKRDSG